MRRGWAVGWLVCGACGGEPQPASVEQGIVGPSGTAMWNRVARVDDGQFTYIAAATTPEGGVVAGGWGIGTVRLGGDPIELPGELGSDLALARYDVDGRLVWQLAGVRAGYDGVHALDVGADGTVVVTGSGKSDIGCGEGQGFDGASFVARVSADGACEVMRTFSESAQRVSVTGAAFDPRNGDIVVLLYAGGPVYIDGEVAIDFPSSDSAWGLALVRLALDGEIVDVATWDGGVFEPLLGGVKIDAAGRIVVAATIFAPGADLGGGFVAPPARRSTAFLGSYTPDLEVAWTRAYGADAYATAFDVRAEGDIALTGRFRGTIDFGETSTETPFASYDGYVVKLTSDGSDRWNKHLWGDAFINVNGVAIDPLGFVIVAGSAFRGVLRFGSFRVELPPDEQVTWAARLGTLTGSVVWARTYEGGFLTSVRTVEAVENARRFYLVGTFRSSLDLGDDRGPMTAFDVLDASYVARLVR